VCDRFTPLSLSHTHMHAYAHLNTHACAHILIPLTASQVTCTTLNLRKHTP